jgi:gamma-tubulin complex component 5
MMSHAAKLGQLTDGLTRSVVGDSHSKTTYERLHNDATKVFRSASRSRTNQFEIRAKYEGLVEKFAVRNREDLSDGLQSRLEELPPKGKWTPEVLSLLLALSDKPVEKTKLENVETIVKLEAPYEPPFSWGELATDADEDGLWDDIERGYHSSGDEYTADEETASDQTVSTKATSVADDDSAALARLHLVHPDENTLAQANDFCDHLEDDSDLRIISELSLIRETLLMLHGLPTSLYILDDKTGVAQPASHIRTSSMSHRAMNDAMLHFAGVGTALNHLRGWVRRKNSVLYIQSCQTAVQQALTEFCQHLATLERKFTTDQNLVIVSILDIRNHVESQVTPLLRLSSIVASTKTQIENSPFALLDGLYNELCVIELANDNDTMFSVLLPIFFAGLKTYLRGLANWMFHGTANRHDRTALAADNGDDCRLGEFWRKRFIMNMCTDGSPKTPIFIRRFADQLFAAGKSRAFLLALQQVDDAGTEDYITRMLDFKALEAACSADSFLPFSQLLEDAVEGWLSWTSASMTHSLAQLLLQDHRLLSTMQGLSSVFCSEDGTVFQTFVDDLFHSMDHNPSKWKNEFLLSELATSTLGINAKDLGLTVHIHGTDLAQSSIQQLGNVTLQTTFSWPIQNITNTPSPATYSKAFTVLLQVYRSKYLLRHHMLDLRTFTARKAQVNQTFAAFIRLRAQLLAVVDILHAHITTTAKLVSRSMISEFEKASDVDAMISIWAKYDKQLETSLLLSEKLKPLRDAVVSYLELCERFSDLWGTTMHKRHPHGDGNDDSSGHSINVLSILQGLEKEFSKTLSFFMAGIRNVGRASGNTALDMLADRLEWTVQATLR